MYKKKISFTPEKFAGHMKELRAAGFAYPFDLLRNGSQSENINELDNLFDTFENNIDEFCAEAEKGIVTAETLNRMTAICAPLMSKETREKAAAVSKVMDKESLDAMKKYFAGVEKMNKTAEYIREQYVSKNIKVNLAEMDKIETLKKECLNEKLKKEQIEEMSRDNADQTLEENKANNVELINHSLNGLTPLADYLKLLKSAKSSSWNSSEYNDVIGGMEKLLKDVNKLNGTVDGRRNYAAVAKDMADVKRQIKKYIRLTETTTVKHGDPRIRARKVAIVNNLYDTVDYLGSAMHSISNDYAKEAVVQNPGKAPVM